MHAFSRASLFLALAALAGLAACSEGVSTSGLDTSTELDLRSTGGFDTSTNAPDTSGPTTAPDATVADTSADGTAPDATSADTTGADAVDTADASGFCGDGIVDPDEACDSPNLNGATCVSEGFSGGGLGCNADCTLDTSSCVTSLCGNGIVDLGESCDGPNLDGATCGTLGEGTGTLTCAADCLGFDTSACVLASTCGDGLVDVGEVCDGAVLLGATCASQGMGTGTLACGTDCQSFDYSGCVAPGCGNGVVEAGEDCDGGVPAGTDCTTLGFTTGALACGASCQWDVSACSGGTGAWTCDPTWQNTGLADDCDCGCGVLDGDCTDGALASCSYNNCPSGQVPDPVQNWICVAEVCGDGMRSGVNEACDGADLGGFDCTTLGLGFTGGTLGCATDCSDFDTSACTGSAGVWTCDPSWQNSGLIDDCDCGCGIVDGDCADASVASCHYNNCPTGETPDPNNNALCVPPSTTCGDNAIDPGEICDGVDLSSNDCTTLGLGFTGGTLGCATDCTGYDTSACTGAPIWTCDPSWQNSGILDDCDCGCGVLDGDCADASVASCHYNNCPTGETPDPNNNALCVGPSTTCGDNVIDPGEVCDGVDLNSNDCTTLGQGFTGGTLSCATDCSGYDTSACTGGATWTCDPSWQNTGLPGDCDCGCGVLDGDCADASLGSCDYNNCPGGGTPDPTNNALCTGGVPATWTCLETYYDAADGCDCNCGAYDPDCSIPGATVYGCGVGETCDATGACVP